MGMSDTSTAPHNMRVRSRVPMTLAALVGVELEHVAGEQNQHRNKQQEGEDGEAGEDDDLAGGGGVEEVEFEGVQRGEGGRAARTAWSRGR